jgi:hypothetical protein
LQLTQWPSAIKAEMGNSNQPIAPCGMCRQSLQEYEMRVKKPIRLILAGLKEKYLFLKRQVNYCRWDLQVMI